NLVSNAIDAYATVPDQRHLPIRILLFHGAGLVHVLVEDHGQGIAPDALGKVFEPFFTTKSSNHGTGIGLSISRQIIEQDFHGLLSVQSTLHVGTTFTVLLPGNNLEKVTLQS